ncbi:MAG: hypothetical protein A2Z59_05995 [Nitrospinae bacterium RIFCSPLOWO2_02_39_17]|nr:MAG: hypothetical protein A2Z59_05995 [Nitrospinae bacterium RIFCSPLOWO2_02_39_17]
MCKIQIIGSRRIMEEVIELLHSLSVLHIDRTSEDVRRDMYYRLVSLQKDEVALRERAEKILQKIKDLILLLYRPSAPLIPPLEKGKGIHSMGGAEGFVISDICLEKFMSDFDVLEDKLRSLHKKRSELKDELSLIERYEMILKGLTPLIYEISGLKHIESTGIIIEKNRAEVIPLLEEEIHRITSGGYQIFKRELDDKNIGIVLTYQKDYDKEIMRLISEEGISEMILPMEYTNIPFFDALRLMLIKKEGIPHELSAIEKELELLSQRWYWEVYGLIGILEDLVNEFKALSYCLITNYTFFISGWVPEDYLPQLKDEIKNGFGESVVIRELEIREDEIEKVPVFIRNPKIIKPFEIFMNILPPPRYDSIDPTPFLAIFFPAFFGLIIGDSGYGLLLLIGSVYLLKVFREKPIIKDLMKVFFICSIYSVVFGFLFGDFFGINLERFGIHPILLDRGKAIKNFLILSIAIGVGHVFFGFMLSLINSIQWRRDREAIGKASSIVMLFAILLLVITLFGYISKEFLNVSVIIIAIALPVLLISEGLIGVIEFIKSIGNILSYARIMALGLASVMMALIANRLGEMSGNIVLGIIIAFIIHTLHIIIGVFSATIQSLRLHYVEFFSKFYRYGDRRYIPFRKIRGGVRLWRRL